MRTLERIIQGAADVTARAVMEERERCARVAETDDELTGEPGANLLRAMLDAGPIENARAAVRATKNSIARRIRDGL